MDGFLFFLAPSASSQAMCGDQKIHEFKDKTMTA